jgi:hypothetical protein
VFDLVDPVRTEGHLVRERRDAWRDEADGLRW